MRLCLMIEGQEGVTWDQWVALAGAAEAAGLEGLFRSDHYSSFDPEGAAAHDAWATIAALSALTRRLRLGTLVSPATFRHPSVVARMVATADHVSGGRVELGLGAGWFEREHVENGFPFGSVGERFDLFAEHVELVVRHWTEERFDHDGRHYRLRGARSLPRPLQRPHPPLILGGTARPRSAALAARFAQEYNTVDATVDECRARREALTQACREAGRDPGTLAFSLMTAAAVGRDRAEADGRLARLLELAGRPEPSPAWLAGTLDEVAERLGRLADAGVERVFLQHLDHADLDHVAVLAELDASGRASGGG
jgi:F420-dependent oxidoreductase-like protein